MSNINTTDLSGISRQYAARDLPGERTLKYRESGQGGPEEIRRDKKELRRELEEKEKLSVKKDSVSKRLSIIDKEAEKISSKKAKAENINLDADEVLPDSDDEKRSNSDSDTDDDDDSDDDDDDDDTEALMAELNKIKKERAIEAAKQEAERKEKEEKIRVENILKGNPLLNSNTKNATPSASSSEFKVKRRWDDDVVFKNCAKMDDGKKKDFINDTLRSEFHKKFMDRYVR